MIIAPLQTDQATSLDRLHDIVLPAEVSGWPPALGWYGLWVIAAAVGAILGIRYLAQYRANAYRRRALRELETLSDPAAIAELLRRTALAIEPRWVIAARTGRVWVAWLESQSPVQMPESVQVDLGPGVYQALETPASVEPLKRYAAQWIATHRRSLGDKKGAT